jgi:hypothetical protein
MTAREIIKYFANTNVHRFDLKDIKAEETLTIYTYMINMEKLIDNTTKHFTDNYEFIRFDHTSSMGNGFIITLIVEEK